MVSDGFSESDRAKPAGKLALRREEKEWKALAIWHKTTDLKAVRDQIPGVQSLAQAQVLVNRAIQRWQENSAIWADQEYVRNAEIGRHVISDLYQKVMDGDSRLSGDLVRMLDRQSKLLGLDKQREQQQVGPNIIVNVGIPELPERPSLPSGATAAIEETIDGEVVE